MFEIGVGHCKPEGERQARFLVTRKRSELLEQLCSHY